MKLNQKGNLMAQVRSAAWLLATLGSVACSAQDVGSDGSAASNAQQPDLEVQGEAIIGGIKASSEKLNVVGSLAIVDPYYNEVSYFCSATLIAPETVVTARHCVDLFDDLIFYGYGQGYFAVGPDSTQPEQLLPVVSVETSGTSFGGFIGYGVDVGIVHLGEPAEGEFNFPQIGVSSDLEIGEPLVSVGYGTYSAWGASDGKRRIGRETVAATEGLIFEAMFGTFENFVEWWFTGSVTDDDFLEMIEADPYYEYYYAPEIEYAYEIYVAFEMIPGSEMVAGLAETDTQSCYGDSGSPMLRFNADGTMTTFGVVSGGLSSNRSTCDFGGVYATFTAETAEFIETATAWVDPCGDVGAEGTCADATTRTYCQTAIIAGVRELVTETCADGVTCEENEYGAGCGAAPEPPPVEVDGGGPVGPDGGVAEAPVLDVESMVAKRYYPIEVQSHPAWK